MIFKVKVLEVAGTQSVDTPEGQVCEPGGEFITQNSGWIGSRKHWHYIDVEEGGYFERRVLDLNVKEAAEFWFASDHLHKIKPFGPSLVSGSSHKVRKLLMPLDKNQFDMQTKMIVLDKEIIFSAASRMSLTVTRVREAAYRYEWFFTEAMKVKQ